MALPSDPRNLSLGSYNANNYETDEDRRKRKIADQSWQLSDNSATTSDEMFVFNLY